MSVIVRFAPSPTGRLHVGNVRTALMNWLFAKAAGGQFILRIDDTDVERSEKSYEEGLKTDLTWLGLDWDDTFKQSDKFDHYDTIAQSLKDKGLLYPCYETAEELDRQRKLQRVQGKPPVYNRAALTLSDQERADLEAQGRKPHWRFKLSGQVVRWQDAVRGEQTVDTSSLSDPVLIRGDGSYLYTLPSVVDDVDAGITHIIRGEDHVTNSGAQIEIFQALSDHLPSFAHMPLLVGKDGKGLSKRLGSLSMEELRAQGIEPLAVCSLLAKLGTSDPVEARHSLEILSQEFSFDKIGRAPARFDEDELKLVNARLLHDTPYKAVKTRLDAMGIGGGEEFWNLIRANIETLGEAAGWNVVAFAPMPGQIAPEDQDFCALAADSLPDDIKDESWSEWVSFLKDNTGRKGKNLFMPLRLALTGRARGPEMDKMLGLIGAKRAKARLRGESA